MKNPDLLDLYSDYLISSFGPATGTGLAALLDGAVSHDRLQRFLAQPALTSADLWPLVKPHLRAVEQPHGCFIIDDSIAEKPYTDENDLICWHYDHAQGRTVKGINFLSALYHVAVPPAEDVALPVGFRVVAKTEQYVDPKDGKTKRRSPISKNAHYQALLRESQQHHIRFRFVLNDVWYASAENMMFIKHEIGREFIMPLKTNRKVCVSAPAKRKGQYVRLDSLTLDEGVEQIIYLEGVDFPLVLIQQVFVNEDGRPATQYLVCSETTCRWPEITTTYRTRWSVEVYHKSLKQNAGLERSPTQTVETQTNHLFAAVCGYLKLELLKRRTQTNHFALKSRVYLQALHAAFAAVRQLQPVALTSQGEILCSPGA